MLFLNTSSFMLGSFKLTVSPLVPLPWLTFLKLSLNIYGVVPFTHLYANNAAFLCLSDCSDGH